VNAAVSAHRHGGTQHVGRRFRTDTDSDHFRSVTFCDSNRDLSIKRNLIEIEKKEEKSTGFFQLQRFFDSDFTKT
jgi:hypothetical protein